MSNVSPFALLAGEEPTKRLTHRVRRVAKKDAAALRVSDRVDRDLRQAAPPALHEVVHNVVFAHELDDRRRVLGRRAEGAPEESPGLVGRVEGGDRVGRGIKAGERRRSASVAADQDSLDGRGTHVMVNDLSWRPSEGGEGQDYLTGRMPAKWPYLIRQSYQHELLPRPDVQMPG